MVSTRGSRTRRDPFEARMAKVAGGLTSRFPRTAKVTKTISQDDRLRTHKRGKQDTWGDDDSEVGSLAALSIRKRGRDASATSEDEDSDKGDEDSDEAEAEDEDEDEDEYNKVEDDAYDSDTIVDYVPPKPVSRSRRKRARIGYAADKVEVAGINETTKNVIEFAVAEYDPTVDSPAALLFMKFPVEVHQYIADYLPSDKDVFHYSLICKASSVCITDSIWRLRHIRTFDEVAGMTVGETARKYAYRRDISKKWICFDPKRWGQFDQGTLAFQAQNQKYCLEMLRGLIIESNARVVVDDEGNQVVRGFNLNYIRAMLVGENGLSYLDIIDAVLNTNSGLRIDSFSERRRIVSASMSGSLVYVVQLCLTPFSLDPKICDFKVSHFDISQYQAYAQSSHQPIFRGTFMQDLNCRWLLHVVNFFKFHLKARQEGNLQHAYKAISGNQYPQPWVGRIQSGTQPLGSHWKGAYMYMEPSTLISLRNSTGRESDVHADSLDGNEAFQVCQDISLFFDEDRFSAEHWSGVWELILCSDPFKDAESNDGRRTRSSRRISSSSKPANKPEIKHFWGSCRGTKQGHLFGRIHAMVPQQGIHGFQRITMMKFYTMVVDGANVYDPTQVWAYEGCVLPGGSVVVGRWWDARSDPKDIECLSGPFIWWNVATSEASPGIKKDEAFDFMDLVEPGMGLNF